MAYTDITDRIIAARVRLLLNAPFFGNLATRLKVVDASAWCPTAATDGRHMYYNKEFFEKLDDAELEFVIGHEVMHCVYDHMDRRGSRDPRLWNCAGDYVINLDLVEHNIGRLPDKVEPLYDKKYKGMSADEIYGQLEEDQKNGKGDENMDSFDVHMEPGDGDGEGEGGEGDDQDGDNSGKHGRVRMTEEERKQLESEIKQAVMQAAKAAGAGNTPAQVRNLIEDITNPQMDWREILQSQIQSCFKTDFTFQIPSRKSWSAGCYLPGMKQDQALDVDIAIDTSGSISNKMLKDFLGEVHGIMEQFVDFKLRAWCFDTSVHNPQEFNSDSLDDLLDYDIQGGGGTDSMKNWEFMKEEGIQPHQLIVMTDGYFWGEYGDPDYCDTIWLVHSNNGFTCDWGITCFYEAPEGN